MSSDVSSEEEDEDDPLVEAVAGVVTGLTLLVAFGLMFAGVPFFWVVFILGFAGVMPVAVSLAKYYQRRNQGSRPTRQRTDETADALEELRERYARGELSDEEFDRRVERLLETESVEDAQKYAERVGTGRESDRRERELDRE